MVRGGSIPPTLQLLTFKNITMSRKHREILKNQLFNYDYSNTPENKMILVQLSNKNIVVQYEGPDGFTHWGFSTYDLGSLVDDMNREVSKHPDYDLIIVDTK